MHGFKSIILLIVKNCQKLRYSKKKELTRFQKFFSIWVSMNTWKAKLESVFFIFIILRKQCDLHMYENLRLRLRFMAVVFTPNISLHTRYSVLTLKIFQYSCMPWQQIENHKMFTGVGFIYTFFTFVYQFNSRKGRNCP